MQTLIANQIFVQLHYQYSFALIFYIRMTLSSSQPTPYQKILVGFLYFLQGVFLVIPGTMILTYKQMPPYSTLALFSFAILPFSFKFIAAPLVQKFTVASYGRRKTWVVISLILSSILLILATKFTGEDEQNQKYLAMCLTLTTLMIAIEDINTDALSVKELNSTELASYMQCVMQPVGAVVGSLFFLELVAGSLYLKLGFTQPFLTVNQYFYLLSGLTLVSGLVIHQTYAQKVNDQQKTNAEYSLWQVIKHYKYFVHPKYRLCRQGITFLIQTHGLVYFSASFTVQLIKANIISKDLLTSISNILIIPVFFLTNFLRKHWTENQKIHKRMRILITIRTLILILLFLGQFQQPLVLYTAIIILSLMNNSQFFLNTLIINNFAQSRFAGMYVTMMASFVNLGNNSTIQLEAISMFGKDNAAIFGFVFAAIVMLSFGRIQKWIKSGLEIQQEEGLKSQ